MRFTKIFNIVSDLRLYFRHELSFFDLIRLFCGRRLSEKGIIIMMKLYDVEPEFKSTIGENKEYR